MTGNIEVVHMYWIIVSSLHKQCFQIANNLTALLEASVCCGCCTTIVFLMLKDTWLFYFWHESQMYLGVWKVPMILMSSVWMPGAELQRENPHVFHILFIYFLSSSILKKPTSSFFNLCVWTLSFVFFMFLLP